MTAVPIFIPQKTPLCPKCSREENTVQTCRHCGYEYEDVGCMGIVAGIVLAVVLLWIICTLVIWFIESHYNGTTLLDVLRGQWEWVKNLRPW